MPINESDRFAIRIAEDSAEDSIQPKMSAGQALPQGRIGLRSISELREILGLPAAPADAVVASGITALAITDTTNVAVSVAGDARFQRVGNTVFVSGSCTIDTTLGAPTTTVINIALPIASTLAASTELSGSIRGNVGGTVVDAGTIVGDVGSADALATWEANHTDVQTYTYEFSYEVI